MQYNSYEYLYITLVIYTREATCKNPESITEAVCTERPRDKIGDVLTFSVC